MSALETTHPRYTPSDLLDARDAIATEVVQRQFARDPSLANRYGPAGQHKCWEDARYHILYLAEAVAAGSPELFRNYATWLRGLLASYGVPRDDLLAQFAVLADVLGDHQTAGTPHAAVTYLEAILQDPTCIDDDTDSHLAQGNAATAVTEAVLTALLDCDRLKAIQLVEGALAGGMPLSELYLQVFQPLLREVGRLWQTNRISVAQEHYCTAAVQLMMGRVSDKVFSTDRNGRTVVAACVGDELHEVGLRMVADLLQTAGWDTHFLGANVPTRDLLRILQSTDADVLCLSATLTSHLASTHEVIDRIRAEPLLQHLKVVVGGYPFNVQDGLWQRMNADGHALDAQSAVHVCTRLIGA